MKKLRKISVKKRRKRRLQRIRRPNKPSKRRRMRRTRELKTLRKPKEKRSVPIRKRELPGIKRLKRKSRRSKRRQSPNWQIQRIAKPSSADYSESVVLVARSKPAPRESCLGCAEYHGDHSGERQLESPASSPGDYRERRYEIAYLTTCL